MELSEATVLDKGVASKSNILQPFVDELKFEILILISKFVFDLTYPAIIISVSISKVNHHSKFYVILPKMI